MASIFAIGTFVLLLTLAARLHRTPELEGFSESIDVTFDRPIDSVDIRVIVDRDRMRIQVVNTTDVSVAGNLQYGQAGEGVVYSGCQSENQACVSTSVSGPWRNPLDCSRISCRFDIPPGEYADAELAGFKAIDVVGPRAAVAVPQVLAWMAVEITDRNSGVTTSFDRKPVGSPRRVEAGIDGVTTVFERAPVERVDLVLIDLDDFDVEIGPEPTYGPLRTWSLDDDEFAGVRGDSTAVRLRLVDLNAASRNDWWLFLLAALAGAVAGSLAGAAFATSTRGRSTVVVDRTAGADPELITQVPSDGVPVSVPDEASARPQSGERSVGRSDESDSAEFAAVEPDSVEPDSVDADA